MRLIIIRHAIAEDHDEYCGDGTKTDRDRPLTPKGIKRMRVISNALANICPQIDLMAYSPYVRTSETAAVLQQFHREIDRTEELEALMPGQGFDPINQWVCERVQEGLNTVAIVGHEPTLSVSIARWVGLDASAPIRMKKGAVARIDFSSHYDGEGPRAELVYLLQPAQIRAVVR